MAFLGQTFDSNDLPQGNSGSFEPLPEGFYNATITQAELKPTNDGTGRDIERLAWHFIGPIQSNKTRAIAESFDWVHSVDREKVARRLSEQRPADRSPLQVCIQVDVSGEATKSGCDPDEAVALARVVASLPGLRLRGVMAIPAPTDDPTRQRAQFARVREVWQRIRDAGVPVDTLSMGMSGDLEAAVAEGATIVRIGTALFGTRPAKTTSD